MSQIQYYAASLTLMIKSLAPVDTYDGNLKSTFTIFLYVS